MAPRWFFNIHVTALDRRSCHGGSEKSAALGQQAACQEGLHRTVAVALRPDITTGQTQHCARQATNRQSQDHADSLGDHADTDDTARTVGTTIGTTRETTNGCADDTIHDAANEAVRKTKRSAHRKKTSAAIAAS